MTYNTIFDGYFSSYWICMGAPLALIPLYFAFRSKLRKGKDASFGEMCVIGGYAFVMMMIAGMINPMYWGFGSPEAVREMRFVNGNLLVIDHIRTMGSESDEGTPCSRVHVVDPKTGEKRLRFTLGEEADIAGIFGDTLVALSYTDPIAYSLSTGNLIYKYTYENLAKDYPELSTGVNSVMWGNGYSLMEITANNGKQYNLDFATGKFYYADGNREPEVEYHPTNKLYADDQYIKRDNEAYGSTFVELRGKNGNQYEEYLSLYDSILNPTLTFLSGYFVAVTQDTNFVILSYETLERQSFKLTCVSRDCKNVVWEIRQAQYNSDFKFNDYLTPHTAYDSQQDVLTFWIGQTVYCVEAATGKLVWETEL